MNDLTREELFPKSEFPLRARQTVEFPEKSLRVVVEAYYQKPVTSFDVMPEQTIGGVTTVCSLDGSFFWCIAEKGENTFSVTKEGIFAAIPENGDGSGSFEKLVEALYKKFEDVLENEEKSQIMNGVFDSAPWEMF